MEKRKRLKMEKMETIVICFVLNGIVTYDRAPCNTIIIYFKKCNNNCIIIIVDEVSPSVIMD